MEDNVFECKYQIKKLSQAEISHFLNKVNHLFIPRLSETVNILDYSKKLSKNAIHFSVHIGENIIALIAVYFNDIKSKTAYITILATVEKYQHHGIATELIKKVIKYTQELNYKRVVLESDRHQVTFYQKCGFIQIEEKTNSYMMQYHLEN